MHDSRTGATGDAVDATLQATARARDVGTRALAVTRVVTIPVGIGLGLGSSDVHEVAAYANSAFAAVWILATTALLLARQVGDRALLLVGAVDLAIVVVGVTVTGGPGSDMRYMLGVLAIAAGFAMPAWVIPGIGAVGVAAVLVPDGLTANATSAAIVLLHGTFVGLALAVGRATLVDGLAAEARELDRLVKARRQAAPRERDRATEELQGVARAEVVRLRDELAGDAAVTPDHVARTRAVGVRVRGLVSELHALSARPIALGTALSQLAHRRTEVTGVEVAVHVDEAVTGRCDELVLALVRDLLDGLIPVAAGRQVVLAVTVQADGVAVDARLVPDGDDDPGGTSTRPVGAPRADLRPVRERLAGVPGAVVRTFPDGAAVDVPLEDRDDPVARDLRTVVVGRVGATLALIAIAAVAGADDVAFWAVVVLGLPVAVPFAAWALRRSGGAAAVVAGLGAADLAVLGVLLALADDARGELLVLVVALAPLYALAFPRDHGPAVLGVPAAAVAGALGLALVTTAVGGPDGPFLVAFAWATVVTAILGVAGARGDALVAALREERRVSLLVVLAAEEAERRDLARRLHDDALQLLLSARQDVEEAAGTSDPEARRRASDTLDRVLDVLPVDGVPELDGVPAAGFAAALVALASQARHDGGLAGDDDLAPVDPGPHAGLLLGVARELLLNVVRHAGASRVDVVVRVPGDGDVTLDIRDDGRGIAPGRLDRALREGHIGLAAARDRVGRVGGSVEVGDADPGTRATVVVPAAA